jgi:hypothetical protein
MLNYRIIRLTILLFFLPLSGLTQNGAEVNFDPRDFSGIWAGADEGGGGEENFGPNKPALTTVGEAVYLTRRPTRSTDPRVPGTVDPEQSNDPTFACNPRGFPRTLFDTNVRLIEFVHLGDRVLQLLQRGRTLRELWIDGRELPTGDNRDNIGPSWYGHSVAEWQGDELVVNTVGLDDRAWLDSPGNVKSFEARIEERYRLIDGDTLEMEMTLYDPMYYTAPYVAETRIFRREPRDRITYFGWYGLFSGVTDLMCAPMNAIERQRGGAF